MFGAFRTVLSIALIATLTWFAFSVDLGSKTFAEHVDRISDTPEAQELLDGARERVNPALEDAKQRVLGEHIEAPTAIKDEVALPASGTKAAASKPKVARASAKKNSGKKAGPKKPVVRSSNEAAAKAPSDAGTTRLPGRG